MVRIRENRQKYPTGRTAKAVLLRTDLSCDMAEMFVGISNVLCVWVGAP